MNKSTCRLAEVPKVPVFAPDPHRFGSIPAPSPAESINLSGERAAKATETRKLRAPTVRNWTVLRRKREAAGNFRLQDSGAGVVVIYAP